jgi:hypothetical protein
MTIDLEYRRSREGLIQAPSASVRNGAEGCVVNIMRGIEPSAIADT